jgi:predicted nucleotidyltransferase
MKGELCSQTVTLSHMRQFIENKNAKIRRENAALWRQAVQDADSIIKMIIARFDPQAIYQWGSVLDGSQFSGISDIDIAVEGLGSAERYFALLGEAEQLTRFPVDLVEIEHVEPEYARLIKQNGKCVYQRLKCGG